MKFEAVRTIKLPTTVHDLALAPGGECLWVACLDGSIRGVDLETEEHFLLGEHSRYSSGGHGLQEGETVISAGYDGALLWHDVEKRSCFRRILSTLACVFEQAGWRPRDGVCATVTMYCYNVSRNSSRPG